ncbi:uncharacterized protein LOC120289920 [Eucalyptus grandis]|uniref:uncharacterized protein LOC120289920 n=1 Tax=Eucalyptus grandis TaxID=71139 RepID=UPI00192EC296|nr:uncharacterized protein LOC120289920 [Eucalyptus grandis]
MSYQLAGNSVAQQKRNILGRETERREKTREIERGRGRLSRFRVREIIAGAHCRALEFRLKLDSRAVSNGSGVRSCVGIVFHLLRRSETSLSSSSVADRFFPFVRQGSPITMPIVKRIHRLWRLNRSIIRREDPWKQKTTSTSTP